MTYQKAGRGGSKGSSIAAAVILGFCFFNATAQSKPDAARGQQIATTVCAACHGGDGNSLAAANPHLAGQGEQYIATQLAAFKSGVRPNPIMQGMAANLSPDDMKSLGAYFATQKLTKPALARDAKLAAEGQQIYRAGIKKLDVPACAGCHGANGAGIPAQYPRLGGQNAEYTVAQLTAFRDNVRNNSLPMTGVAAKLNDREIKAVADYIAGLR